MLFAVKDLQSKPEKVAIIGNVSLPNAKSALAYEKALRELERQNRKLIEREENQQYI